MHQYTTVEANTIAADLIINRIKPVDRELVSGNWTKLIIIAGEPEPAPESDYWVRYKHSHVRLKTTITDTRNELQDFIGLAEVRDALTEYVHDNTRPCCCCEERLWEHDNSYVDENGQTVCEECRDAYYGSCEDCRDLVHYDDMVTDEGISLCGACYRANYSTCSCCGRITPDSEIASGTDECETCYDSHEPEEIDYPQPHKHEMFLATHRKGKALPSDLPPIGIEIEFYADANTDQANSDIQNFFYRFNTSVNLFLRGEDPSLNLNSGKSWLTSDKDSSLSDYPNGIEIMTLPLRIETWLAMFQDEKLAESYHYMIDRTNRQTGLHISIPAQIAGVSKSKVMFIFNALCRYFDKDLDEACAWIGRTPSSYSNNRPLNNRSILDQCQKHYGSKQGSMTLRNQPRPDAKTIQEQLGRLEFRAPRTPDTFEGLKKRLTKFATMLRFCKTDIIGLYTMTDQEVFQELQKFEGSCIADKAKA